MGEPGAAERREETVTCLLLFGADAMLVPEGGDEEDAERWPASAIAADTGLEAGELPGRRFRVRVRVSEDGGRVSFSKFTLAP
jgi:hypothetical protein